MPDHVHIQTVLIIGDAKDRIALANARTADIGPGVRAICGVAAMDQQIAKKQAQGYSPRNSAGT
jgi:hypothetical protein